MKYYLAPMEGITGHIYRNARCASRNHHTRQPNPQRYRSRCLHSPS